MYEGKMSIKMLLDEGRLKEALVQLEGSSAICSDWQLRNRIEELKTAYGYMLQYARMGMPDPNRENIFHQFIRRAYELADWLENTLNAQTSGNIYDQYVRTFKERPAMDYPTLQMLLEAFTGDMATVSILHHDKQRQLTETEKICRKHEQAIDELFYKIWTSRPWSDAEAAEVESITQSVLVPSNDKAVLVSAVTLALMQLFDERKMNLLMKLCKHEDVQVNQRALVGLAITLDDREEWMERYPALLSQLTLLLDENTFCRDIHEIQMQILMSMETEKISRKMHEEIIPGIMKNPGIRNSKFQLDEEEDSEERNPEWEDWMKTSGMDKKIRELGELQMQGADVYMSTFAQLKSYPFFNQVPHWFYPFDFNHTDLLPLSKELDGKHLSPLCIIIHSDTFCNSDKYSFCITFAQMSPNLKEKNMQALQMQMQMDEEQKNMLQEMINRPQAAKSIRRQYIQDLYRFCKIWGSKHQNQIKDIFNDGIYLWTLPYFSSFYEDAAKQKDIADFLFEKEHWDMGEELYIDILQKGMETAEVYQKLGYIRQMEEDYYNAIMYYERADLHLPDNVWTMKHLIQCYKQTNEYEKAVLYLKKLEKMQPENLKTVLQLGNSLMKSGKYDEALPYLHKVEYLGKSPENARRAIGWCLFMQGKYEDALKYFNQLLQAESPTRQDWMNTGHVYLGLKQIQQALAHYAKAKALCESHTDFIKMMHEDKSVLLRFLSDEELSIMLDLLV